MELPKESIEGLIEFFSVGAISFTGTLTLCGLGVLTYHLSEKYQLVNKSKKNYSQTKNITTYFINKYRS